MIRIKLSLLKIILIVMNVHWNMGEKEFLLKEYKALKDCTLFVRPHEKEQKDKYLVKVGIHKFIIKVTKDNMEFLMDLC